MKHKKMYILYKHGVPTKLPPSRVVDILGNKAKHVASLRLGEQYGGYPLMIERVQ